MFFSSSVSVVHDRPLVRLMREVGHFGLSEMRRLPGLIAEIDQHAAAVRSAIEGDGARLTPRTLTQYALGFLDGVRERGWVSDGRGYDWETTRLLAICWLAREAGFVRLAH
ncbi:MAG: hypothetical protein GEV11_13595 [Streptosporangiales bacterium]|nr:hypothetical protein [Streptosporangiales bacterium]